MKKGQTLALALALVALGSLSFATLLTSPALTAGPGQASIAGDRLKAPAPDAQTADNKTIEFVPGQVIVLFRKDVSEDRIRQINTRQGTTVLKVIPNLRIYLLKLPEGVSPSEAARRYRRHPEVVAADPNSVVRAVTNDILFPQQWYFDNTGNNPGNSSNNLGFIDADIDAPVGWLVNMGASTTRIAILDTGIDGAGPPLGSAPVHPDLVGKIVGHANLTTPPYLAPNSDDVYGHGTHVAGLAAARTNNGLFIAGTCPLCSLLNVKVLNDSAEGQLFDLEQGINWAVNNGAKILNASLAGPGACPGTLQFAIDTAVGPPYNAIFVAAAGNNGANLNTNSVWPAACSNVVTVAATDARDDRAYFSNYGAPIVAIAAPGKDVLSLFPPATMKRLDGTSMAAPIVSGALGVIWARFPTFTNTQVKSQMFNNADKIDGTVGYPGYPTNINSWQYGRLNLCRAVGAADCDPPNPKPFLISVPNCPRFGVAGTVTLDLSTGASRDPSTGNVIDDSFGTQDSKWSIIQVPSGTHGQLPGHYPIGFYPAYSIVHLAGNWVPDPSGVNWVHPLNSPAPRESSRGFYKYRVQFRLPGTYTSLSLTGDHAEDDRAKFFLNGNQIIPGGGNAAGGFSVLTPFAYNSSGMGFFTLGTNELVVEVENAATVTGLLVHAKLSATCPPITYRTVDRGNLSLNLPRPCALDPGMVAAASVVQRRITLAQTFTPTQNGYLTTITHGLQSVSGVKNYDLLVTTTRGGLPKWTGGTYDDPKIVLFKGTGTVFSTSGINAVFTIPSGEEPYLIAGTQYALILIPGSPATGHMRWQGNGGASSYPNGSAYELKGTTWIVPTMGPKDHGFKLDGLCP